MARRKDLEDMVIEWAAWHCRVIDSSIIGYPHQTAEARIRGGGLGGSGNKGSKVPHVMMHGAIKIVDRAVRAMPSAAADAIKRKYCYSDGEPIKRSGAFNRRINEAFAWIEAAFVFVPFE